MADKKEETSKDKSKAEKNDQKKEILKEEKLEQEEEKPVEKLHLKTRQIPAIVMLTAGLIASVSTFIQHLPLLNSLVIILVTLLVFLFLGSVAKSVLDLIEYDPPEDPSEAEDGDEESLENIESRDNPEDTEAETK